MPRALPGKRREAKRLVEEGGLSLAEAADALGVNRGTVRAWQKADEQAGSPWQLQGLSAAQHEKAAAEGPAAQMERTERARRATRTRWADRRAEEADYFGSLTGGMRTTAAEAITAARIAIAQRDADQTMKWARALRDFAVTGGIFGDKADKFADISSASSVVAIGSDETYQNDLAEVLSLVERIDQERSAG